MHNMKKGVVDYGMGWTWDVEKDIYRLNDGEFNVTGDVVRQMMRDWRRKIEPVHIQAVCSKIYRMHLGIKEPSSA